MTSVDHFKTRRLIAERLRETHLDDLLRMDQDPRIMSNMGGVRSEEGTREYFQQNLEHWEKNGFGLWMLRLQSDDSLVGRAYLRHLHIAGNDEVALGYALFPDYWGMGFATEIAAAVVDVAFDRLGMDNIVTGVLPENRPSHNVVDKIGGRFDCDTIYKGIPHVLYRIRREARDGQ